jgi:hypothetical protein
MVFFTLNPKRVLAACCSVDVIKGAVGFEVVGLSSRLLTLKADFFETNSPSIVSLNPSKCNAPLKSIHRAKMIMLTCKGGKTVLSSE